MFLGERFVYIDTNAGSLAGMHVAISERIRMREDLVRLRRVLHVFLNSKIVHAEIEVQRRAHADWAEIGRAVRAGADLVEFSEARNLAQVRDSSRMNDRC